MLGGIGVWELLLILFIVLIIFGAGKLPEIGAGLGKGIGNFRKATTDGKAVDVTPDKKGEVEQKASNEAQNSSEAKDKEKV